MKLKEIWRLESITNKTDIYYEEIITLHEDTVVF